MDGPMKHIQLNLYGSREKMLKPLMEIWYAHSLCRSRNHTFRSALSCVLVRSATANIDLTATSRHMSHRLDTHHYGH
jgi:hypothetical protein